MLSWPSTLGLSPIVACESPWTTDEGRDRFLELVIADLQTKLEDDYPTPIVEHSSELDRILDNAIAIDRVASLENPGDDIMQAVRVATMTLLGRIRMHDRLAAMRATSCIANEPRGVREVDDCRETLYGKTVRNAPGAYHKYLASQNALRMLYS